jgi:hypothetical protein
VSGKKLALVCFSVGVFVLYAYQALLSLFGLVSMPQPDYSLLALSSVFTNAFVAGFALGFCPPVGLYLMMKCGLIHGWEAGT